MVFGRVLGPNSGLTYRDLFILSLVEVVGVSAILCVFLILVVRVRFAKRGKVRERSARCALGLLLTCAQRGGTMLEGR